MRRFLTICTALPMLLAGAPTIQADVSFAVRYPAATFHGTFSGRVVVYLTQGGSDEPRFGPNWFQPQPMYSAKFEGIQAGQRMLVSNKNAVGYPGKLSALAPGDYDVQAVVDRNLGGRAIGSSPGNLYSGVSHIHVASHTKQDVALVCDKVVPEPHFHNTKHVRECKVLSTLLTNFYHRPTYVKSAVILPDAWFADKNRKFPVVYEIPGFGGDYMMLSGRDSSSGTVRNGKSFIYVFLDPNVPTGHCVFADSANNGPWGKALTTELIPKLESEYRGQGKTKARFVTGHSSGGWSSLWLQVEYPDVFGGVWSTSPDPADFHLFQLVDIYEPQANMFKDARGNPVPLARQGNTPVIFARTFSDMERPIRGEQLGSFEAVFSPRGANGEPEQLWNRDTGAVDPRVAAAWKKYDIALKLRTQWPALGPKLKGKLHIFCGDIDTFYLDGAVRLLKKQMASLGSDAEVEIVPGDHFTMMSPALRGHIDQEMAEQLKR